MNTDIRLSVKFFTHLKTFQLDERCGKEGIVCLLKLWVWAAENRPSGDLSGFCSGVLESISGWSGEPGSFAEALREIGWLDGEERAFRLHGWEAFQLWAKKAESRENTGRMGQLTRKNYTAADRLQKAGFRGVTKDQYASLTSDGWEEALEAILTGASIPGQVPGQGPARNAHTPTPTPTPTPSPTPTPAPKKKHKEAENQKPKDKEPKDPEQAAVGTPLRGFEDHWDGDPTIKKFNPLDYIKRIQEIAKNTPRPEPEKPGSEVKAA